MKQSLGIKKSSKINGQSFKNASKRSVFLLYIDIFCILTYVLYVMKNQLYKINLLTKFMFSQLKSGFVAEAVFAMEEKFKGIPN